MKLTTDTVEFLTTRLKKELEQYRNKIVTNRKYLSTTAREQVALKQAYKKIQNVLSNLTKEDTENEAE